MILPKVRDPRFVTIRRGGTLADSDHRLLALWAASCAEHVLDLFESAQPDDRRPRQAIEHARAWVRGEAKMTQARAGAGPAPDGRVLANRRLPAGGRPRRARGCRLACKAGAARQEPALPLPGETATRDRSGFEKPSRLGRRSLPSMKTMTCKQLG